MPLDADKVTHISILAGLFCAMAGQDRQHGKGEHTRVAIETSAAVKIERSYRHLLGRKSVSGMHRILGCDLLNDVATTRLGLPSDSDPVFGRQSSDRSFATR